MSDMRLCPHCKRLFSREDEKRAISEHNNPEPDFTSEIRIVMQVIAQHGKIYQSDMRTRFAYLSEEHELQLFYAILKTGEVVQERDEIGGFLVFKTHEV